MESTHVSTPAPNASDTNERPADGTYCELALKYLRESPTNPRKTFTDLDGLATSIREKGILQPLVVRRLADEGELAFEIVAGHRRFRAATMAGITSVPCVIRELTDLQADEIQAIENVQRSDLHPLEEADGYAMLLRKHGYSSERLAERIGRPAAYLRDRLRLASLGPHARAAFSNGEITAGVALELTRLPRFDAQLDALMECKREDYRGERPSVREARQIIVGRFLLKLSDAPFDRGDASLVPTAGACTSCPHRSGAQPELFADVKSSDLCTDRTCFDSKKDAHWKLTAAAAKKRGLKVLSEKEAKQLFPHGESLAYGSGYVDLDARPYDLGDGKKSYRQLLKGHLPEVVVARGGDGAPRELVEKDRLARAIKAAGIKKPSNVSEKRKAEAKQERDEKALRKQVIEKAITGIVEFAEDGKEYRELAFWGFLCRAVINVSFGPEADEAIARRGLEHEKNGMATEVLEAFAESASVASLRGLVVELLARRGALRTYGEVEYGDSLLEACTVFGVSLQSLRDELEAAREPAAKAAGKAKPKKGAKAAKTPAKKAAKASKRRSARAPAAATPAA